METVSVAAASDEDILGRVMAYLNTRHFPAFRELDVEVAQGSVTVSGILPSFHEKQVALNSCQRVAGVVQLIDEISVDE